MKRTSVKVLISASIILSMIPFSLSKVSAAGSVNLFTVYSFNRGETRTYMYEDIYLVSGVNLTNYVLKIIVNDYFRNDAPNGMPYTSGVIECDGYYDIIQEIASTGSGSTERRKYTYTITLKNCSYFHFQVVNYGTNTFWDANNGSPGYWMAVTINQPSTYSGSDKKNISSYLAQILTAIQNGGSGGTVVDLSGIENQIDELIELMDLNLAYNYDLNTKLDIIINQLQTQQGSEAQESVDNNEQINENLQTEQQNYEQLEQQFNSDFDNNLNDINVSDWTTRLTGWTSGVNWLKTQMNNMFTSMGDYKYMLEIGMILAIALIFIGR